MTDAFAAINRHELPKLTPDWVNVDHRRGAAFAAGDMTAYVHDLWDDASDLQVYIEVVHRLSNLGVVITQAAHGTSQQGFEAEWRENSVFTFDGDLLSRCELFDEADLDAALAKFEELSRPTPRLENAASQAYDRLRAHFAAGDWEAMTAMLASDAISDDRRRTANAGTRRGPEAAIQDAHAMTDLGFTNVTSTVIAIRGGRLVLMRARYSGPDRGAAAFYTEVLNLVEIGAGDRIVARVWFDPDDFDAAIAELDARYLAGEAAAHSHTWSVITRGYAALNRHELPPTTPDSVSIDHRRGRAFAPGDLAAYIRATWDLTPQATIHVQAVHRLSKLGAVVTQASQGASTEGFDAEWREIVVVTVEGDMASRSELFDEGDLDVALSKFEELSRPAPRLENAASQVYDRLNAYFAARDWAAITQILADDVFTDDRRRVVNSGLRKGRDAVVAEITGFAKIGAKAFASDVIATRGGHLVLSRARTPEADQSEAFQAEALHVVEIDADERIMVILAFDPDDIDAAFKELDARYLAGEAADHAHTWSVIVETYAAFNRHELSPTTPDWVNIDHRRGIAFAPGDMTAYVRAGENLTPDSRIYIETVDRLSHLGAVVTQVMKGTSRDGFDAEWREVGILTVEGDLINRGELFDEADIDAALARFDELDPQTRRLENAASQLAERFQACLVAQDWAAMTAMTAEDIVTDDRRRVVGAALQRGRAVNLAHIRASVDIGMANLKSTIIATRGERLMLDRVRFLGHDQSPEAFFTEILRVFEMNTEGRIAAGVYLDPDDIDAAFEELEARYLVGEGAAHAHAWSVIARTYAAFNRHEFPSTTPDSVYIDHRPLVTNDASDLAANVRATWELMDVSIYTAESVHRLSELGAVVTQILKGTSKEGLDVEYRMIDIFTVEGDLLTRVEVFDETDLDAALARFDELHPQARRLENAASRMDERLLAHFGGCQFDAIAEILADESFVDDRRRIVNAGLWQGRDAVISNMRALAGGANTTSTVVAIRGERLALARIYFANRELQHGDFGLEMLSIAEIDADNQIAAHIVFDPDDLGAAFAELDARYLVGEAAAHAHTWSVIARTYAAFNQHEFPSTTPDPVYIDHRPGVSVDEVDVAASIRAVWDLTPDVRICIEAVHRLSELGAVVTAAMKGTSPEGFDAEWQMIDIFTVEGDRLRRIEVFDEADLDAALARFDEIHPQAPD